jgi:hypothetical protein
MIRLASRHWPRRRASLGTKDEQERSRLAHDAWASQLTLETVRSLLQEREVTSCAFKLLPAKQDNDKNQFYFGRDLTSGGATFIPSTNLRGELTHSKKEGARGLTLFQADVDFRWITVDGDAVAPQAKLIFYPQYPEARLSGLFRGSANPPRTLYLRRLRAQVAGRVLVIGTTDVGRTYGLLLPPESPAAVAMVEMAPSVESFGVLNLWWVHGDQAFSAEQMAAELHGVHLRGWVPGCRLTRDGVVPYFARPAGGATLEAHLGVVTNAQAIPDFQGWELKQHSGRVLTLFTSEPDGGLYRENFYEFMRRYGVDNGRRHDFTGIQRVGAEPHRTHGLALRLRGYRADDDYDPDGAVELVDRHGEVAASWSFVRFLHHWMEKHARVAFVPSEKNDDLLAYRFDSRVRLASGASFRRLLRAIADGSVYYDPACRASFDPEMNPIPTQTKRRNQWRVNVRDIGALYGSMTEFDVTDVPPDNTFSKQVLSALGVSLPTLPPEANR